MTKADVADTRRLCDPSQVGNRDTDQAVDSANIVELQRINDQARTIGQLSLCAGAIDGGVVRMYGCHIDLPVWLVDVLLAFTLRHMDGRVQDSSLNV